MRGSIVVIIQSTMYCFSTFCVYFPTGLLKFCTLGFFFIFHLVDVVLIATQVKKIITLEP